MIKEISMAITLEGGVLPRILGPSLLPKQPKSAIQIQNYVKSVNRSNRTINRRTFHGFSLILRIHTASLCSNLRAEESKSSNDLILWPI